MGSLYVVLTKYGIGYEVDGIGPVYGTFSSPEEAEKFASKLPPVEGYDYELAWTHHDVLTLEIV